MQTLLPKNWPEKWVVATSLRPGGWEARVVNAFSSLRPTIGTAQGPTEAEAYRRVVEKMKPQILQN